jgi:hypothetical protein
MIKDLKMYSDVMVDLETLSTSPTAAILTLGAIRFNRTWKPDDLPSIKNVDLFYRKIDLASCLAVGLEMNASTIEWWMRQPDVARKEVFSQPRMSLVQTLEEFSQWLGTSKYIWSHGDDFDTVILTQAYRACGLKLPWHYSHTRDTRTLLDVAKVDVKMLEDDKDILHHAAFDCYRQIYAVLEAFDKLSS